MATITRMRDYRHDHLNRYWKLVGMTLVHIFGRRAELATSLRRELSHWPEREQIQFYHSEPLDLAATLVAKHPSPEEVAAYRKLGDQMNWGLRRRRKKERLNMSKRDKEIEQAAKRGRKHRERRIENEIAVGSVIRTVVGPDIYYNPPNDPEEKAAYDDEYYNR